MTARLNRRLALGLGTVAAATFATGATANAASPAATVRRVYTEQSRRAGGIWNSYLTLAGAEVVVDKADEVVEAYSVNKVAVATAVLDKIDRGLLTLDQRVDVTEDIVIVDDDGILGLDQAYPSSITLGHTLALLLTVSDNTAVRLCGLVCPAAELNQILVDKGFPKTQVVPVSNPNRFFLGTTTPREMHNLLLGLACGEVLSASSTEYLFTVLRSPVAFTDGIRRTMSSAARQRIATKAGWFEDGRNEAGIVFDEQDKPALVYSLFAHGQDAADDFGATHPAVQARAEMGPVFLTSASAGAAPTARTLTAPEYRPHNGG